MKGGCEASSWQEDKICLGDTFRYSKQCGGSFNLAKSDSIFYKTPDWIFSHNIGHLLTSPLVPSFLCVCPISSAKLKCRQHLSAALTFLKIRIQNVNHVLWLPVLAGACWVRDGAAGRPGKEPGPALMALLRGSFGQGHDRYHGKRRHSPFSCFQFKVFLGTE